MSSAPAPDTPRRIKLRMAALYGLFVAMLIGYSMAALTREMVVNADNSLEWNQKEGFYHASGNAEAIQGMQKIKADSLKAFYDPQADTLTITQIVAIGNVSFSDQNHNGHGRMLRYDTIALSYRLEGPDAMISGPDGSGKASRIILLNRAEQKLELASNAEITLNDGRRFSAQSILIYLTETDNIDRITATGEVSIIQAKDSTATANKAEYNRSDNRAVLTGNVVIEEGQTILSGGRAEIDFASGISKMLSDQSGSRVSGRFTRVEK